MPLNDNALFVFKKNIFYKIYLKNFLNFFQIKPILYRISGLVCEYNGNLKACIIFYSIFLKFEITNLKFSYKYAIFNFWQNKVFVLKYVFSKLYVNCDQSFVEILLFEIKIFEKKKYSIALLQIWKKLLQKKITNTNIKTKTEFSFNLTMYMGMSWIRYAYEHFKSILHNMGFVKLISNYYKFFYQNLKINCIIFRELLSFFLKINIKLKLWKKNQNIFIDFSKSKIPLFFNLKNSFIFGLNQLKKPISIFNIYIKWFKNVKITSHFNLFSFEKKCIYDYLFLFETSYNTFIRSRKIKLKLYNKLIRDEKFSENSLPVILRVCKFIAQQWPRYSRPNLVAIQICKKILTKKLIFNGLVMHLVVKKNKILRLIKKKTNIRLQNLSVLFNKAENFFQKKKSIGFLRLIFFPFIEFQLKNFYLDRTFLSRKNKMSSRACTSRHVEKLHNKSNLVFQSLIKNFFFYVFLTPTFFLSNKIKMVIMNFFFFRKSSTDTKLILLLLALRKKKYDLVYFYCRFLCLQNPTHLFFWYIFSKVGKKIKSINPKTLRFILRLLVKYPKSIPATIFAANYCSIFKSHDYSLAELFQVYRWKKDSPYLFFLIFLQYLYKSLNRKNKNPEHSVVIGLCFFYNYGSIRLFSTETMLKRSKQSLSLRMEIFFNKAIFYLFLKFKYLALVTLKRVLNQKNRNSTISKLNRFFKLDIVHNFETNSFFNIRLICLNRGNKLLANDILKIN